MTNAYLRQMSRKTKSFASDIGRDSLVPCHPLNGGVAQHVLHGYLKNNSETSHHELCRRLMCGSRRTALSKPYNKVGRITDRLEDADLGGFLNFALVPQNPGKRVESKR